MITGAYNLPCRHVIHTVGPVYSDGGPEEEELLASCYRQSIRVAAEHGLRSIAFPSISTGIFGYPVAEASRVALAAIKASLAENPQITEVRLVCFTTGDLEEYRRALAAID